MPKTRRRKLRWKEKLFGQKGHELLVFCFFLAVSFGFWLLQALSETLEREVTLYMDLSGVPDDVVIIDSLPASVSVTLHDRGLILARHSIATIFRPNHINIDFTKYDAGQSDADVVIPAADISRLFRHRLPASTRIQAIRPDTIRFSYNHGLSRRLPVKLAGTLSASAGHYIQSVRIEPDSVTVFAPKAILDTMQTAYTDASLPEDLSATGSYQVGLREQRLLKYEPSSVALRVSMGYYTEKTLQVPVLGLNFPAEKKLRTFPSVVSITFRVESGRYQSTTADEFVLATTYEELLQNTESSKLRLHLRTVPEGVSDVRISPAEVDYLIEQASQDNDGQD